jgi:hypothetical protein
MLGLDQGNLNTPHLVDPATRRSYQVSQTAAGCDCASHLDTVTLDPFEQRNIEAEFVLPRSVTTVDVTVPAIGTFRDVDLE